MKTDTFWRLATNQMLPSGLVLAVVIPLAGVLADRYSPRWITVWGLALFGASFLPFALRGGEIGYAEVVVLLAVAFGQVLMAAVRMKARPS